MCPFRLPRAALAAAKSLSLPAPLAAHDCDKGALSIVHPHARATPGGATTGAGHVRILDKGDTPDRLRSVSSPVPARVELHQTVRDGSIMRMRAMPGGIAVPAKGRVALAPGGYPIMWVGLKQPLKEGQTIDATRRFEKTGAFPSSSSSNPLPAKRRIRIIDRVGAPRETDGEGSRVRTGALATSVGLLLCLFPTPGLAQTVAEPFETILVIGMRSAEGTVFDSALEPDREGRLSTLKDLFATTPGLIVEPVFGGVDHPRFAIRGSGLQRGTMPAGRGIELRVDGLPITYADTSFDFVEWIEPLNYGSVAILRGGRGALAGATSLGGVVDFRNQGGKGPLTALLRGEGGSFGNRRAQARVSGGDAARAGFVSISGFGQQGFRDHNRQEALRGAGGRQLRSRIGHHLVLGVSLERQPARASGTPETGAD